MASIAFLLEDASKTLTEIQLRENDAARNSRKEFLAARCIQKCYRGWLVRRHFSSLHQAATSIQKVWRGRVSRRMKFCFLRERAKELMRHHFATMAARIQKTWRGHFVRTHVFDYYLFKGWIHGILGKNDALVQRMVAFREEVENSLMDKMEEEAKEWVLFILFRLHHLLRTHNRPGVYSQRETVELSDLEQQLKALCFTDHMKELRKRRLALRRRQGRCLTHWWRSGDCYGPGRLFAEGPYLDPRQAAKALEDTSMKPLQPSPMRFPMVRYDDRGIHLPAEPYHTRRLYQLRDFNPSRHVSQTDFVVGRRLDRPTSCRYH